jgi:phosphate transport system substrate-binding protein
MQTTTEESMKRLGMKAMKRLVTAIFSVGLFTGAIQAQSPPQTDQTQGGMIEWLTPTLTSNRKQTEAEAEKGREHGRALPTAEILQPTLDSSLPEYQVRKDIKLSGSFKGASSDVLPGLAKLWIDAFRKYYPNVKIDVRPPYAGSLGAKELVKGTLDFVFVSRELKPDDMTEFRAKFGYDPLSVAVSGGSYRHYGFLDAVGFMVNKENPLEKISFDQLDAILSRTHHRGGQPITTWGQLGLTGEWADKPIHIYGIKPWNGFEEFIRQRVLSRDGKRGEWREDIRFEPVVFPIAKRVSEDRYGIGYSGLAYIDAAVRMLPVRASESGTFYAPTYENVTRAVYPLSRLIFFNTNKAPGKSLDPAIEEFLRFILSRQGQEIILIQGLYIPLRSEQATAARAIMSGK